MSGQPLHITTSGAASPPTEIAEQRVDSAPGPNGVAIRCAGEFDAGSCAMLRSALERASERDATRVLVDLTETTFVDCQALTLIVATAHRLADRGGTLVLALGRGQPRRLAELTGLADLLGPGSREPGGQAG